MSYSSSSKLWLLLIPLGIAGMVLTLLQSGGYVATRLPDNSLSADTLPFDEAVPSVLEPSPESTPDLAAEFLYMCTDRCQSDFEGDPAQRQACLTECQDRATRFLE